jgi:hypothetical protein
MPGTDLIVIFHRFIEYYVNYLRAGTLFQLLWNSVPALCAYLT